VQRALEVTGRVGIHTLLDLVETHCCQEEYRSDELEKCFETPLETLFADSPTALVLRGLRFDVSRTKLANSYRF
jgi:hypothetical protein